MNAILKKHFAVANFIIDELHKDKPFNLVLNPGQTLALNQIALKSQHLHCNIVGKIINATMPLVHKEVGMAFEVNDSNADPLYHMLSSYMTSDELPESVILSLMEVS